MIKYFDCNKYNYNNISEQFKNYVKKHHCPEIFVDLSTMNVIDAMKFILLSSAYHYSKYPFGKFRCHVASEDIKNYIKMFTTANLELV